MLNLIKKLLGKKDPIQPIIRTFSEGVDTSLVDAFMRDPNNNLPSSHDFFQVLKTQNIPITRDTFNACGFVNTYEDWSTRDIWYEIISLYKIYSYHFGNKSEETLKPFFWIPAENIKVFNRIKLNTTGTLVALDLATASKNPRRIGCKFHKALVLILRSPGLL